jgi:cytidine deaminase
MDPDNERVKELFERAREARKRAYAPYSEYPVGAALLTRSGQIFVGVNVENAAYPSGICAERSAVFSAVTQGEKAFDAIVIASENGGEPCGACRQVLAEFGMDLLVIASDKDGEIQLEANLKDLYPLAFGPEDLIRR